MTLTAQESDQVFHLIAHSQDPMTAEEVAAATDIDNAAVVGGIADLIRQGRVSFSPDDDRTNRYIPTGI